jgi:hypothetical protein
MSGYYLSGLIRSDVPMSLIFHFKFQRKLFLLAALVVIICCWGCTTGPRYNGAADSTGGVAPPQQSAKLMIFGGENHEIYLGCLSCSNYALDSVFNEFGQHGSPYASESIWNHYSVVGSRYSNFGACNPYANDPPVIVDSDGNFYGRLSLNAYHPELGAGARYRDWLETKVCED